MKIKIRAGANTWLIATQTLTVLAEGTYEGRLLNEIRLNQAFSEYGTMPLSLNINIANYDGFIPRATNLWAQSITVTTDVGRVWSGKITAQKMVDGVLQIRATEKSAPELNIQIPDEIARVVTVDENFHVSALNVTLPLPVGGNVVNPIALRGILVNKNEGIYALSVGELHQFVSVRVGDETIPIAEAAAAGYATYTGAADQEDYPGIAYVQITDPEKRKNDDGSYVDIGAEVIGVKLGTHTIEECRNGARFLYWLLKTPVEGGWGIGLSDADINLDSITASIAKIDAAGLKMDGVFYFRQPAMSWINQICLAIRGRYWIGADSKRSLFVNAASSSVKTYDSSEIKVLGSGREDYTGIVFNKGTLHFDYNPITSQFMQSVTFRDETSISALGEQEFEGQSYLLRDRASAQAILDYTCKKSIIGAETVEFQTRTLPDEVVKGAVITLDCPEEGLSGDWEVYNLDIGDRLHIVRAERYSSSVFSSSSSGFDVAWSDDPPIVSAYAPGAPSGLDLTSGIDYDSAGDGSAIPYIAGAFEIPAGKYIGAAIAWGEGADPSTWNDIAVKGNTFKISPVKAGQLYTVKVALFNQTKTSATISGSITAASHNDLPPTPTVSAQPGFGCIVVSIGVADFTALAEFEIQRRKSDGSGLTIVTQKHRSTRLVDDSPEILTNYTLAYQYQVRSVSNSRQFSAWSAWSDNVSPVQVQSKDITDLPIIGKQFLTAEDVGEEVDGVKFTADGIEMWRAGIREVLIPSTGSPVFRGTITALAGYIGECVIADGGLRSADFVSQHRGWSVSKYGDAEFNNLRARGAIETAVFRKDEISVVGGKTLIRPAAVVEDYDYNAYLDEVTEASFDAYWAQLDELLDESVTPPEFAPPADYDEFYETELSYWMQLSAVLVTGVFTTIVTEADFSSATQQAALAAHWAQLDELLDESVSVPTFPLSTFTAYEQIELGGWMQLNEMLDLDVFEPAISENDTRLYLDYAADFAAGDVVRLKSETNDYWAVIASVGADYVDLSQRSGAIFDITPGQAVVNYGKAGSGGILLDGQSPLIDLFSHAGEPWNGTDLLVRQGNLNGWGGINSDVYGLAIGTPESDYILAIPGQGIFLNAKIQISGGAGIANLIDAGAAALADDLDGIGDGATYKRVTANEKTGAGRAYSGLDANNRLITAVIPATAVSPSGSGLYLGSNYLGFYNSGWKTYMDNSGNFALVGSGAHGLSWNAGTGVLNIVGSITVSSGSTGFANFSDKPTSLSGINSTEGSKLAGIATGADVTSTVISGGLVTTGTLQVRQGGTANVAAGMTGNTTGDTAVRIWAGSTFDGRTSAPFRVLQNGAFYATNATISGVLTCGSGSSLAGFSATTTDLTAGSSTTAIGISTDTSKKAFWAGGTTPSTAPFQIKHDGTGKLAGFDFSSTGMESTSTFTSVDYETLIYATNSTSQNGLKNTRTVDDKNYSYVEIKSGGLYAKSVVSDSTSYVQLNGTNIVYIGVPSSSDTGIATNGKIYAAGGFFPTSDESVKSDIADVSVLDGVKRLKIKQYRLDEQKILEKRHSKEIERNLKLYNKAVADTPLPQFDVEDYRPHAKNIGVMAADFNDIFGTCCGDCETYNLTDAIGVALRAIQELADIVDKQAADIAALQKHQEAL